MMRIINKFTKTEDKSVNDNSAEIKTLYSSHKKENLIEGIELPEKWINLGFDEIKEQARQSILDLSRSSNSDFKAKELGFNDAEHLMKLCFDFILK